MIDNLVYDPMKQISINLELYFESYTFLIFRDFFRFFFNFHEFKIDLFNLNSLK